MAIKKSDDSMCKTWPSNSGYTFLIAIKDYNFQNDGEDFLNSGAGISITNGLQTVEREMEATTIVRATEFYLFGCLDVSTDIYPCHSWNIL